MSSDKVIDGFADNAVKKIIMVSKLNAETSIKHFVTKSEIIDNNTNLKEWYKEHVNDKMLAKFEEFQEKDSVVCALYPAPKDKNVSRVSSYPHFSKVLKLGNIKFPIALKDIPNFEQLNGLAINVFTVVDKEVAPLIYTGRDCQDWFANELHQTALELNYILNNPKPMTPLGSDERHSFRSALTCHICEGPFDSESDKVMDHDHFTDSFRFMSSSLSKLSSYLDNSQKKVTRKYFIDDSKFELVTRKGVFPYEYLDCWEKLTEECLPPHGSFFSKIHNETITDADYSHACHVWQSFQIKNLQEYAELYLKTDVLLLTDVFENFRNMCMKTYKLDALHYYTAPGLAFDAMLKITNVNLELLTDIEMATFIQKGIRGGISQCCNRYGEANNPYMGKHYKPDVGTSYLMYYDINNLYGTAMSTYLPYGAFEWVPMEYIYHENILNQPDDGEYGYVLEVDLKYPVDLFSDDWIILKKAKGIQRSALKEITFDDYYKCLMDRRQVEIQQNFITTSKHNVYTVSQKKVALSPYDDKRMVNYLYTDTEEPHAKKPKRRIVPTPVNTDTPQDPIGIRSTVSTAMVKTKLTAADAKHDQELLRLLRQPIVKYNLTRLFAVCAQRCQLSKNDVARLFVKTPEIKDVPPWLIERHFAHFELPNPPEDSDYDSDDTIIGN
nr:unnamed protein product [Callosobruchus analis]